MKKTAIFPLVLAIAATTAACTMPAKRRGERPTPVEQLLISEAIERGIDDMRIDLPEPSENDIFLDTTGLTGDQIFMGDVMRGWLGRSGFDIEEDIGDADIQLNLVIESLGTHQKIKFFGMPASRSAWLPVSVPELALYKKNKEEGYVRFYFDAFDARTHEYLDTTRTFEGSVHLTKYTFFFIFDHQTTDMKDKGKIEDLDLVDPE
jgi:hypothetical protein